METYNGLIAGTYHPLRILVTAYHCRQPHILFLLYALNQRSFILK